MVIQRNPHTAEDMGKRYEYVCVEHYVALSYLVMEARRWISSGHGRCTRAQVYKHTDKRETNDGAEKLEKLESDISRVGEIEQKCSEMR